MINTRSIRFRLTAWYALVLTAGLGLFGTLVWIAMQHQLSAQIDGELQGRASRLEAYFTEEVQKESGAHLNAELVEFSRAFGPGSLVEIKGAQRFAFQYPQPSQAGAETRALRRSFAVNGEAYDLLVVIPTAEMSRTLNVLRGLLLALIPVVILIASIGGALLSGRALRPVTVLTEAANRISIENLSQRLPAGDTGDELARLSATLNNMLARLEGAVTTLSQFVADASHEFRTPLAVIQTTVELALRRVRPAEEYRRSLEEVGEEVSRMIHLVEDLLALARTDTVAVDMPRTAIELRGVVEDVLNEMRPLAGLRQVRISYAMGAAVWITGNRAAVHRLFLVIIDNALKYSKAEGEVVVSIEQAEGSKVCVRVEDSGCGIAPEHLPHIFKRFYRGDAARSSGGHGLGLALADSIVRAHGARIAIASTLGVSTEVRVEFEERAAVAVDAVRVEIVA